MISFVRSSIVPFRRFFYRVKHASWTMVKNASAMTRPRRDDRRVHNLGKVSGSRLADTISTPRAWLLLRP